jgi:hypothetical protein
MRYVVLHKWYVLVECFRVGLYWRGLVHDLSKLLPSEFLPYARFFYGKKQSAARAQREKTGYYKPTDTGDMAFDFAWLLHQKRNDHHWQWWLLPEDEGGVIVLPMDPDARLEMLCDWKGAGRAQGKPNTAEWWETNKHKMQLHADTRAWIERQLQ